MKCRYKDVNWFCVCFSSKKSLGPDLCVLKSGSFLFKIERPSRLETKVEDKRLERKSSTKVYRKECRIWSFEVREKKEVEEVKS